MSRVAYLTVAIVVAAALGSVGLRADTLDDARAQAWLWPAPAPVNARPGAKDDPTVPAWFWSGRAPRPKKPRPAAEKDTAAPQWFWSFPESRQKRDGQGHGRDDTERRLTRILFFSGTDLWRHAAFAHDGILWMPAGEGNDGFVLKAMVSDGSYQYRAGALGNAQVTGWMFGAAVMPGVQFKRLGVSVGLYAGVDYQIHRLSMFDPGNDLQGRHVGVRLAADLWAEPTPQSMLAASATISTVGGSYAARIAAGWRMFERVYLGPEAMASGGPTYSQFRIGLHVTGLTVRLLNWRFEWQGGLGYAIDDDRNDGLYARLGLLWRH